MTAARPPAVAILLLAIAACGGGFTAGVGDASADGAAAGDGHELEASGHDAAADVVDQVEAGHDAGDASDAIAVDVVEASPEGGPSSDASDGCVLASHADGFGQSFEDCTPAGSYTEGLAMDACEAFEKGSAAAACVMAQCPSGSGVVCTEGLASSCACWVYSGPNTGHARAGNSAADCPCDDLGDAGATTAYQ